MGWPVALCAALALLAGCATTKSPSEAGGANAAALAARADPSGPKPFADVISGATQQAGWLAVWRKGERFWIEIPEAQLQPGASPWLLSANVLSSVGERGLYASRMGPDWLVSFRKMAGHQVQLVALNTRYVADNQPLKRVVEEGFSNSLLASLPIVSAPHPERKSVLVDASFVLSDLMSYGTSLEQAYRLPYALDRANSSIEQVQVTPDMTSLNVRLHFATSRLPVFQHGSATSAVVLPSTPDPRSILVGMVLNFSKLPEQPMRPRLADTRLGHFAEAVTDLSDDRKAKPRQSFINRWRLEKQDLSLPLSPPKKPIVYWLDKNIPERYRASVTAGVLEWNKAFEKIGFKDAIVVKQQPDDAGWSTLDARHASIRWYAGADAGVAVGPHHADPRTGEILDADIAMSDVFGRSARRLMVEDGGFASRLQWPGADQMACEYGPLAATEMGFAMDLLEVRGELEPDSPEVEAFAQALVKETITHEVGHTLGLRHNFKASTAYSPDQLRDKAFTEAHGISASVMDYNAVNLPLDGESSSTLVNKGVGPYDEWAIEYAYRPLDPATEAQELARIASRSTEPGLLYADDADAGLGHAGIDPLANRFDLSSDPLGFWQRRIQLAHELWRRVQQRGVRPGDDMARQRRALLRGFLRLGPAAEMISKFVGGIQTSRSPATPGQPAAYAPVPSKQQRQALHILAQSFFDAESFQFQPEFLATAATDYDELDRNGPMSVPTAVLQLQTSVLDRLLSPGAATRLLEARLYAPAAERAQTTADAAVRKGSPPNLRCPMPQASATPSRPVSCPSATTQPTPVHSSAEAKMISLDEVYRTLQESIWSELSGGRNIDSLRRNLQREYLRRLQLVLTRAPSAGAMPADALSLLRMHATTLQSQMKIALGKRGLSVETQAHLQDGLAQLTEALRASMQRAG